MSLTTVVRSVKILALKSRDIKLDMVIDLMKCFPCLEKLYIMVKFSSLTVLELFIHVLFIGLLLCQSFLPAMWFEFPYFNLLALQSCISGREMNWWRRKHGDFIKCYDIRLKTIVLAQYQGIRSQVNFASFFLLNARELELMTLEVESKDYNEEFIAEQHEMLQMEKKASRGARLHFTANGCQRFVMHVDHIRDLSITDPFECRC